MPAPSRSIQLLRVCGVDEALAGDLLQEVHAGRSGLWLWWEVSAAIFQNVRGAVETQRRLAIESVIVGWALFYLFSFTTHQFITAPLVFQLFGGTGLGAWGIALAN